MAFSNQDNTNLFDQKENKFPVSNFEYFITFPKNYVSVCIKCNMWHPNISNNYYVNH